MIPKLEWYKKIWQVKSDQTIKPGLERIQKALEKVGNPEKKLHVIHVTGTNGKGSTIAFMEGLLVAHNYSVGTFTSPAMMDIHDQIRINNKNVSQERLDDAFKRIKEAGLSGLLTDFELLTVAAFLVFAQSNLDYVLMETGMGGLQDSTNIVMPVVSVITSVALDHKAFLGETLSEVATQKAGIIKPSIPVVIGELPAEAEKIIREVAGYYKSNVFRYEESFKVDDISSSEEKFIGEKVFHLLDRKMKGSHQAINLSMAIEALLIGEVSLEEEKVQQAVKSIQIPYRFEEVAPNVFLDGAHNPAAAKALVETIKSEFPGEKVDFVIGMLKTKEIKETIDILSEVAHSFTFLTFPHQEAATGEEMMRISEKMNAKTIDFSEHMLRTEENRPKVITGSLYLLASLTLV